MDYLSAHNNHTEEDIYSFFEDKEIGAVWFCNPSYYSQLKKIKTEPYGVTIFKS